MKKRIFRSVGILLAISVVCAFLFVYMAFEHGLYAASDKVVGEYTGSANTSYLPDMPCYKIAQNPYDQPFFTDPDAAFQQASEEDCAEAIELLYQEFHEAYHLASFGKDSYQGYKVLGRQLVTDDETIQKQGSDLTKFLDICENSEKRWLLTSYGWTLAAP